jgi:DNA gyrase subunit A
LKEILEFYIEHRKEVVRRRAEFDLKKAKERAHILEGLAKALDHIDQVIATIKKSKDKEEAHKNLMAKFKLTAIQTTAILEMRLQTLAALEAKKIDEELKEKKKLMEELELLLKSAVKMAKVIKEELIAVKEKYGDERRTKVVASELKEFKEEDLIAEENVVIALSQGGYIKRVGADTFKSQKRGGKGLIGSEVNEEDFLTNFTSANTHDNILFFTDKGRVFQTKVYEIPQGSRTAKGKLIQNFLEIPAEEKISAMVSYANDSKGFLVMITKEGTIKKTSLEDFSNIRRTGIIAINLSKGDSLKGVKLSSGKDEIITTTSMGQAIRFKESQLKPLGRSAAGVRAIKLKKGDTISGFDVISLDGKDKESGAKLLVITELGFAKQTALKEYKVQSRGGSGIKTAKITAKTGNIVSSQIIRGEEELIAISAKGQVIRTELSSVRVAGRATSGVRIMKLNEKDRIAGIAAL